MKEKKRIAQGQDLFFSSKQGTKEQPEGCRKMKKN